MIVGEVMYKDLLCSNLFNFEKTIAKKLFLKYKYPWEILPHISDFIAEFIETLDMGIYEEVEKDVFIAKNASVDSTVSISAPCIVCEKAQLRHCAFLRGKNIVGKEAVVGNSTELKNVILFDSVQVPHYNYVGDSILGYKAHMGAGAITSNVKSDKSLVSVKLSDSKIDTGLKKFGAILADKVEVGCNTVLNPGTVVGKNTVIYPLSMVRGYVKANSIFKKNNDIVERNSL